jgi:hypothetical protein
MIRKLLPASGQTVGSKLKLFGWGRRYAVVRRQQASRIGFSIATTSDSNVVDFTLLSGVCPDVLWCIGSGSNVNHTLRWKKYFHVVLNLLRVGATSESPTWWLSRGHGVREIVVRLLFQFVVRYKSVHVVGRPQMVHVPVNGGSGDAHCLSAWF